MCTVCSITQTFDPVRHVPASQQPAVIREMQDALSGLDTEYEMAVGDTFMASIDRGGDRDWIRIDLEAGNNYEIAVNGSPSGGGTLSDPTVYLYDATGREVASNDDGGPGLEPLLQFLAAQDGTYFIATKAFSVTQTGTYQVRASLAASAEQLEAGMGSLDELSSYLTDGYWQSEGTERRSFDTSGSNVITVDLAGLTSDGKKLARWAMESWERVADLEFREVSRNAQITFDDNESGAYATSVVDWRGNIESSFVNVDRSWIADYGSSIEGYAFSTYIHEIGHALGLGHMGDYNGDATYGKDEVFTNDSWAISVMSYFNQSENTSTNASYASVIAPQQADIAAIHTLYGASQQTSGNTIWGQNSSFDGYLGVYFASLTGGSAGGVYGGSDVTYTIADSGGTDMWDLRYSQANNRVDLRAETFSDIDGLIMNVSVARGTVLERAQTGDGNDSVTGNDANNWISAGAGNDQIDAGLGNDTLYGGAGGDALFGRAGNDYILGGSNLGMNFDQLYGGEGNDNIRGEAGFDRLYGENGNDTLNGGAQADNLFGGNGTDRLFGEQGFDRLFGGNGDDFLYGGFDTDAHFGEAGNDLAWGGPGNDRFFGGQGNDQLFGEVGDDMLNGGAGFDVLRGGAGNDQLYGRFNADRFVFEDGHGRDTVYDFDARNPFEKIDLSTISTISGLEDLDLGDARQGLAIQSGNDVVIDTGAGGQITLLNVSLSLLDATDFVF